MTEANEQFENTNFLLEGESIYTEANEKFENTNKVFILKSKCDSQRQYGDLHLWKISNPSFVYTQMALPKFESIALVLYHPLVYIMHTTCSTKVLAEIGKVI